MADFLKTSSISCSVGFFASLIIFVADLGSGSSSSIRGSSSNLGRPPPPYKIVGDDLPTIVTKAKTFRIPEEQSVLLPCDVQNRGDHVVVWRKGHEVLSAGEMIVSRDSRLRLLSGASRLSLHNIQPQDAGDYVCQVSVVGEPLEVAHTVEVLVPPRVRSEPEDGNIVAKKGMEVNLECQASGNPVPRIVWSREHNLLPEGTVSGKHQHGYTIRRVTRFDAGRYTCTADNGVGSPARAHLHLQVLYEPEIEVEAEKVHSGLGKEAHLTCIVHGEPRPLVKWYRENIELSPNEKIRIEDKEASNRHTLILRGLDSERDFGNYSCLAENSLGVHKKHIEVHGRPTPAVFRNKPQQDLRNSFRLVWTVDSYTRIEEYRLLYRQIKPFHPDDGKYPGAMVPGGTDWTNIIIPGDRFSDDDFHHEKMFLLTDLRPDAQYECLVQAKNRYGWSEASRIHNFYTRSLVAPAARDLGWKAGTSSASATSSSTTNLLLLSSAAATGTSASVISFLTVNLVRHIGQLVRCILPFRL